MGRAWMIAVGVLVAACSSPRPSSQPALPTSTSASTVTTTSTTVGATASTSTTIAPLDERAVDLRILGWRSGGPLGDAMLVDLTHRETQPLSLPHRPRAALLPDGGLVVSRPAAGATSVSVIDRIGRTSTPVSPLARRDDAYPMPDSSGRVVWIVFSEGPRLRELYRHRLDDGTTTLVHPDVSSLVGATHMYFATLTDVVLASTERGVTLIRSNGSVADLGPGGAVLAGDTRWIRSVCDGPIGNSCRFEIADVVDVSLAIPIDPTYQHLTAPRNGLPTGLHPISVVTRDGRRALVRGFADGRVHLLQVDLATGAVHRIHTFEGDVDIVRRADGRAIALADVDPFAMYSRDGRHVVIGRHLYSYDATTRVSTVRASAELLTIATGVIEPLDLGFPDGFAIGTTG